MDTSSFSVTPSTAGWSRRDFLGRSGGGFGLLALTGLLDGQGLLGAPAPPDRSLNPLAPLSPHFSGKAKSVIWLFMNGGPSQVDTWDYKPELAKRDGQELKGFDNKTGFFTDQVGPLMKSPFQWKQHGASGTWVPEIFPAMAHHLEQNEAEAELAARIESFELAYRMQMAAPEALDVEREPEKVKKLYGLDNPKCGHFARQCLMARRMVERGVRFVQIYSGGMENELSWDGHTDIASNHRQFAGETDQPVAALLADLKQRGLLDSTLVIWGGEFGRLSGP